MDIQEIPNNDKKIHISKMKMTCDDRGDIPSPLPPYNSAILIYGQPGSGKTNLWLNMITKRGKFYNRKFDRVMVFSPSLHTIEREIKLPNEQIFNDVDYREVRDELNYLKEMVSQNKNYRTLFVFDDVMSSITQDIPEFLRMLGNRRHHGLTVMIITQVYNKIPMQLRKMISHFIFFKQPKQEQESIYRDLINLKREQYYDLLKYVYDKQYQFLYFDKDKGKYYKNFNELKFKSL